MDMSDPDDLSGGYPSSLHAYDIEMSDLDDLRGGYPPWSGYLDDDGDVQMVDVEDYPWQERQEYKIFNAETVPCGHLDDQDFCMDIQTVEDDNARRIPDGAVDHHSLVPVQEMGQVRIVMPTNV